MNIAAVEQRMSDSSSAWNVSVVDNDGAGLTIATTSEQAARRIARELDALLTGADVAWVAAQCAG